MIYYLLSIVVHFLFCASVVNFIENPDRQYDAETVDKVAKKSFPLFPFWASFRHLCWLGTQQILRLRDFVLEVYFESNSVH